MFNAIKYTERLEKGGLSREGSEACVSVFVDIMNENFATKSDLFVVKSELQTEMQTLRTELRTEMQDLKTELRTEMQDLKTELRTEMQDLKTELRTEMQELKTELRTDMQGLKSELKADMQGLKSEFKELEYKLTIKLGTMLTIAVGVTATLFRLLESVH